MRWIKNWWYARQRQVDIKILWPECVRYSPNLEMAKAMFEVHAYNDFAWMVLGEEAVEKIIDGLVGGARSAT